MTSVSKVISILALIAALVFVAFSLGYDKGVAELSIDVQSLQSEIETLRERPTCGAQNPTESIGLSSAAMRHRVDVFWCDYHQGPALQLAQNIRDSLRDGGIADVRLRKYSSDFRRKMEARGISAELRSEVGIRYLGFDEEQIARSISRYMLSKLGIEIALESVKTPTVGIVSIFVCPGYSESDALQDG